jgi:hypothetical protein
MKSHVKPLKLFLILALIISYGNTNKNMPGQKNEKMLKFKKLAYIDAQGTGLEAFSFLMPSDWKFEGITWKPIEHK